MKAGEAGSSTMPHKVNPIDFENSEGNLGLGQRAAATLRREAADLLLAARSDRFDGPAQSRRGARPCAAGLHGIAARGLPSWRPIPAATAADLEANPEVLAEAIQTVMRRCWPPTPYEQLKALTRGRAGMIARGAHRVVRRRPGAAGRCQGAPHRPFAGRVHGARRRAGAARMTAIRAARVSNPRPAEAGPTSAPTPAWPSRRAARGGGLGARATPSTWPPGAPSGTSRSPAAATRRRSPRRSTPGDPSPTGCCRTGSRRRRASRSTRRRPPR